MRWYFAGGFIIHLAAMTGCWWMGRPIMLGIYGGSAIILMFELQRGGNATTRTMLSLPVTADQLARCWRFVGLGFPVVLFLIPLLLGALIGASFAAPHLTAEFLLMTAISQTLGLGVLFFTLTGVPGQPRPGATLWQRGVDIVYGMIWGGSMSGIMFLSMATPLHFADFDRGGLIAGLLLAVATVAGWFRADILVRNRTARPETAARNPSPVLRVGEWKRFGAMPFLALRQGSLTLSLIITILLIQWFAIEWHRFGQSLVGAVFMAILLPLTLRFGLKVWIIFPVMMFASLISSAGPFLFGGISEIHSGWWAAASVTVLAAVWWISYRLLGTPHPWRANAMKGLTAARRM